jgi:hypothetical protein
MSALRKLAQRCQDCVLRKLVWVWVVHSYGRLDGLSGWMIVIELRRRFAMEVFATILTSWISCPAISTALDEVCGLPLQTQFWAKLTIVLTGKYQGVSVRDADKNN